MRQDPTSTGGTWHRVLLCLTVSLLAAAAGLCAMLWAVGERPPDPDFHRQDFTWTHPEGATMAVTEARPFLLPQLFRDFDLYLALELTESTAVDLVFRRVEPRVGAGGRLDPFHGRFSLVRLSTVAPGPPYRTREQALFGVGVAGIEDRSGVLLVPGVAVTVVLQARGRFVRANIGGRWLPWFETADRHGSLALVAHGGKAVLRHFRVSVHDDPLRPLPGAIAAIITGLAFFLVSVFLWWCGPPPLRPGRRLVRLATALVVVVLGGGLAHVMVFHHSSPQAEADGLALCFGSLCALPLAVLLLAAGFRPLLIGAGLLVGLLLLETGARMEADRLEPLADPRLDLHFGITSGSAPFDALSLRLRSALAVHTVGDPPPKILLLGGGAIFEAGADRRNLPSVRLRVELQQATGRAIDVIVAATTFGHALQQSLLYRRFYERYTPEVIVFAVGPLESFPTERVSPREVLAQGAGAGVSTGLRLLDLFLRTRDGRLPPSTPEDLRVTVSELHGFAAERSIPVVVVTTDDVDPGLVRVLDSFCRETGSPFVQGVVDSTGAARMEGLAKVLAGLMR